MRPKPKRWPSNRRPSRRRSSRTLTPSRRRNRIFDDEKRSWRTTAGPSMSWPAKPKRTGAQSTDAPGIFKAGRPKSPRSPRRSRLERKRSARSSEPFGTETRPSRRERPAFRKSGSASRPIPRRCKRDSTRPGGVRKPSAAIRRTSRMPAKSSRRSSESCSSSSVPSIAGSAPSRRRRPRWTAYRRTSPRERPAWCPRRRASQSGRMSLSRRKPT